MPTWMSVVEQCMEHIAEMGKPHTAAVPTAKTSNVLHSLRERHADMDVGSRAMQEHIAEALSRR